MPFLAPVLPAIIGAAGTYFAGQQAAKAAAPAAQAQAGVAQTQTDVINALLGQYQNLYAPYEQELVGRQQGMMGMLPYEDVISETLAQLRGPFQMPPALVARALTGAGLQTERERGMALRRMGQAGFDPSSAAGQSILSNIGETGLRGQYGILSDVMGKEAEMGLQNQLKAYDIVNQLMGGGLQTAGSGRMMLPGAMQGLQGLGQQYGMAAQGAAAPWQNIMQSIPSAVASYYAYQNRPPATPGG